MKNLMTNKPVIVIDVSITFFMSTAYWVFLTTFFDGRLGGRRFSEGTSADREIQRTLMEVCSRSY